MFSSMRRAVPAFRAAASRAVTGRVAVAGCKSNNVLAAAKSIRLMSTMDTMASGTPTCECTDVLAHEGVTYAMHLTRIFLFRYRHVALSRRINRWRSSSRQHCSGFLV